MSPFGPPYDRIMLGKRSLVADTSQSINKRSRHEEESDSSDWTESESDTEESSQNDHFTANDISFPITHWPRTNRPPVKPRVPSPIVTPRDPEQHLFNYRVVGNQEAKQWTKEQLQAKLQQFCDSTSAVIQVDLFMWHTDHKHDVIDQLLAQLSPDAFASPFGHFSHFVRACANGCMECVKLVVKHQQNTQAALGQFLERYSLEYLDQEQTQCLKYFASQIPMHKVNLGRLLPLLVCFKSSKPIPSQSLSPINKHYLFTTDAFRYVFRFAIVLPLSQ